MNGVAPPNSQTPGHVDAVATVRTAVVVRTPLLREGLALVLSDDPGITISAVAATIDEIGPMVSLDVIVLGIDDLDATASALGVARATRGTARIVGCHDGLSPRVIRDLEDAGVSVLVDLTAGEGGIREAVLGSRSRSLLRWEPPAIGSQQLTTRERAVLAQLASGAGSREIGETFGVSTHTIESHKQRLFRKLGVSNQAQAVAVAIRAGMLEGREGGR